MSAITDRHCGVLLPDGERCGNDFECGLHTLADKKQETREAELKAGEAVLKMGEAALKAQEARLREEELASREARLADEGVSDARMAATIQETVKALKAELVAELAAELEKRTQEVQNERDSALSNTRAQRDSIFQSIRDLRTSLRDRSAAYQDELAGIATQIDNATAQIQALQSSVKGLRLQRDSVTSRYQADKAQREREIDGLQEKITALLG
jgi:archaellum component FlaC